VLHRPLILATLLLFALALRAALGQVSEPPRSPFSGSREDPYFPRAPLPANQPGIGQRFPIANQPKPVPKLAFTEEAAEPPVSVLREPLVREPAIPNSTETEPRDGGEASIPPEEENELGDRFRPGQIVAKVGDQIVLYGDVASLVDQGMAPDAARITNKYQQAEFNARREASIRSLTRQLAEKKLQYVEFRRMIAANAKDKAADAEKRVNQNVQNAFDSGLEDVREKMATANRQEMEELMRRDIVLPRLALLMKENGLETMAQLDETLRSYGSSLDKQLALFREHNLGQQAIIEKIGKKQAEVTHAEMLEYYKKNADKFAVPAKARFEILSIYFSRSAGRTEGERQAAAQKQIDSMGDAVFFGTPLAEVARKLSHDANAFAGGQYDWTGKGSLASDVIDAAIFSLPLNRLSKVLPDERGYHIVRVLERTEATQISFEQAQQEIKETIQREKRDVKVKAVLESLKTSTTIWTIYDDETEPGPAQQQAQRPQTPRR
jgi:parvulin-like peptidyl-prolyl isomerase